MDRPLRPLFPDGFRKDTQVIATVLSSDKQNKADVLALTGASAALHISDIPWNGPIVGIRVGRLDGEFVAYQDRKSTRLNSSHLGISYAVFCLKKKKENRAGNTSHCRRTPPRGLSPSYLWKIWRPS